MSHGGRFSEYDISVASEKLKTSVNGVELAVCSGACNSLSSPQGDGGAVPNGDAGPRWEQGAHAHGAR